MKLLRNSEVVRCLVIYLVISAAAVLFSWYEDGSYGLFTLILCVVFIVIYIVSTARRYKRISGMAEEIDRILHGQSELLLKSYSEGELAILESEIYKMTVRLREQQQRLLDDKVYLADSIADISHQIRTPLTSINLIVNFLSEPEIDEDRRGRLVRELYDLLSRIEWLINSLLKISKLDAGMVSFKKETLSLKELIEKSCETLMVPIELRSQSLEIEAEGNFCGDVAWTCEAVGNVVKNCMEHTPEHGRLKITAAENALFSEIIITDNGSGIDREDLPHIFERFYKGKNSGDNGFGIGLALARMIVVSQNGILKAENNADKGARFTMRFYKSTV